VDARADVFAFCTALYEGLFGVRPSALYEEGEASLDHQDLRECLSTLAEARAAAKRQRRR
jgi:hypothetical protein